MHSTLTIERIKKKTQKVFRFSLHCILTWERSVSFPWYNFCTAQWHLPLFLSFLQKKVRIEVVIRREIWQVFFFLYKFTFKCLFELFPLDWLNFNLQFHLKRVWQSDHILNDNCLPSTRNLQVAFNLLYLFIVVVYCLIAWKAELILKEFFQLFELFGFDSFKMCTILKMDV